jgi:hypothetical protein
MNPRVRIVRRNEVSEPNHAATDSKPPELVRNRETLAVVQSWIDEFKIRSRQAPRVTLPRIKLKE